MVIAVLDELVCHSRVLHHLAVDGHNLVAHVEGVVQEWPGLLVPPSDPCREKPIMLKTACNIFFI